MEVGDEVVAEVEAEDVEVAVDAVGVDVEVAVHAHSS